MAATSRRVCSVSPTGTGENEETSLDMREGKACSGTGWGEEESSNEGGRNEQEGYQLRGRWRRRV